MKKEDTVLAGFHAVSSRMKRDSSSIRIVYYDPKRRDQRMRRMIEEIEKAGIRLMQADNNRLDGFSHEVPHQGLIALAAPIDIGMSFDTLMDNLAGNPLLLLLDGVTDPRNFGACLRVADAAGVSAVITPKDRSATLTAAAVKASAGASETVPIVRVTNLAGSIVELVDAGVPIIGTAGEAQKSINEVGWNRASAYCWLISIRLKRNLKFAKSEVVLNHGLDFLICCKSFPTDPGTEPYLMGKPAPP